VTGGPGSGEIEEGNGATPKNIKTRELFLPTLPLRPSFPLPTKINSTLIRINQNLEIYQKSTRDKGEQARLFRESYSFFEKQKAKRPCCLY